MKTRARWVLVTGATGGIGAACTRLLARDGYCVVAASRQGEPAAGAYPDGSGPVLALPLDITSDDAIANAVAKVQHAVGDVGLYAVVNCAGSAASGPIESYTREESLRLFDVNVAGPMELIRAALPLLRRSRGRVVNIGSTSGQIPGVFSGAYCGTKFALEAMHDVLRAELASSGVHVSLIVPGAIATPFWEKSGASLRRARDRLSSLGVVQYDAALERRQHIFAALSRSGLPPEAVAEVVCEALSAANPRSRYVVGRDARWKLAFWRALPKGLRERALKRGL